MKWLREPAGCWGIDCFCVHGEWNSGHTWLVLSLIRMMSARSYYPTCDIILSLLSPSLPFMLFLGRKSSKQFCTKPLSYPVQVENGTIEEMLNSSVDGRERFWANRNRRNEPMSVWEQRPRLFFQSKHRISAQSLQANNLWMGLYTRLFATFPTTLLLRQYKYDS